MWQDAESALRVVREHSRVHYICEVSPSEVL
jgi:hypothetical protein